MTFIEAVKSAFRNYAGFTGRARRSELWWFILFYFLVSIVVGFIDAALRSPILGYLVSVAFLLPILAIEIRRLHDIEKSGWWVFIGLIPIVGTILLIVWWCQDGTTGPNRFGGDPKLASLDTTVFDGSPPPTRTI